MKLLKPSAIKRTLLALVALDIALTPFSIVALGYVLPLLKQETHECIAVWSRLLGLS